MDGNNVIPLNISERKKRKTSYADTKGVDQTMSKDNYITREELESIEEKIDLKIKVAIQPLESKIDNLPTLFKTIILEEREYQSEKRKETNRYVWGTIAIGVIGIVVSVVGFII